MSREMAEFELDTVYTGNRVFPRISISSRVFTLITNSGAYACHVQIHAQTRKLSPIPLSDRVIFAWLRNGANRVDKPFLKLKKIGANEFQPNFQRIDISP